MKRLLDNIARHALAGPHAKYATSADDARRYAAGFTPIAGFANAARPNFGALAAYCKTGERLYCAGWSRAEAVVYLEVGDRTPGTREVIPMMIFEQSWSTAVEVPAQERRTLLMVQRTARCACGAPSVPPAAQHFACGRGS